MVCLFESITTECLCNFRITLTVCLTSHGEILTNFGAFAHKVRTKTFCNNRVFLVLCYTDNMLTCKGNTGLLINLFPLNDLFALRAALRGYLALKYETANRANKFLLHNCN